MTEKDFIPTHYSKRNIESVQEGKQGKTVWKSPSNIALVKYWGKRENQLPANPSISFTLDSCATVTSVTFTKLKNRSKTFAFDVLFEGESRPDFRPKIATFLNRIETYLPFLRWYNLRIETSNSFPHSSGIASSASGMSALALCLIDMENDIAPMADEEFFIKKASFLARLGSGSACRSVEGDIVHWGYHEKTKGSSDLYGIKFPYAVDDIFKEYQDTILLVDKGKKEVSSTLGHNLMHGHPFAQRRFEQAHTNLDRLHKVFSSGDLDGFVDIVESEALTLHAMMMSSRPYFILMKPNTLEIINKIWAFRKATQSKVCFTLDAGANVHVLYPKMEKQRVLEFIENDLVAHCEKGHYICDRIGYGAKKM
ncbi:diphosphomevalonate/mevalonate 3,5-bisphosphate decarboxylase family protein [Pareuzebyella sediminis]|uniref:diphosphomevalonate/mevalonate 3,5-bisphosphate decarboxylase family protein n=1 Tax=Pareuzebyella sediminis TaxID=2607998 RepID=UPI0011EE6623|nr:diphosphomevalonate decarboxylase [Pareuzebyella sediminis]